jgi:hypothetical protein
LGFAHSFSKYGSWNESKRNIDSFFGVTVLYLSGGVNKYRQFARLLLASSNQQRIAFVIRPRLVGSPPTVELYSTLIHWLSHIDCMVIDGFMVCALQFHSFFTAAWSSVRGGFWVDMVMIPSLLQPFGHDFFLFGCVLSPSIWVSKFRKNFFPSWLFVLMFWKAFGYHPTLLNFDKFNL